MPHSEGDRSESLSFFRRRADEESPQPAPGLASGKVVGDFRLLALIASPAPSCMPDASDTTSRPRPRSCPSAAPPRRTSRHTDRAANATCTWDHVSTARVLPIHQSPSRSRARVTSRVTSFPSETGRPTRVPSARAALRRIQPRTFPRRPPGAPRADPPRSKRFPGAAPRTTRWMERASCQRAADGPPLDSVLLR